MKVVWRWVGVSEVTRMKNLACGLLLLAMLLLLLPQGIAQGLDGFKLQGEEFTYKFSPSKEPIQGIFTKPSGNGPFPAVVVNHGGGGSASGFGSRTGLKFKGYVVIAPNLTHIGAREEDRTTFAGSQENADRIMVCVKILESLPYVNAKKLCIYGNSMGAFATIGVCTQTDKFKVAAITAGGVGGYQGLGDVSESGGLCDKEIVAKIRTPFIMCHGSIDTTVKPEKVKAFKAIMDANNVIAELHLFEGIAHPVWKQKTDDVFALILEFFAKHLK